jgi:hypothetical protein
VSYLFSKSTCGFYRREIHGDNVPSDAVEITSEEHAALLGLQSQGKTIKGDLNGNPVAIDSPLPSLDAIKDSAKAVVREARKPVFFTLAGLQSEALANGNSSKAQAISGIQQKLRDLTAIDLSACTTKQQIDIAFLQAWGVIIEAAIAADVKSAFEALA